jgi:hypothetical protein
MSNLASVQIHRLVLRGDTRDKTNLLASLDAQRWPGDDDPRIIFIKRLQVSSPWWTLARELAVECEAEYRAAISAAQASDASNAIMFASEAHLIAQLVINLLREQSPWYQQSWLAQAELPADPVAVLLHRPALAPEILRQLHQQRALADFFIGCSQADLQRLVTQLQLFLTVSPRLVAQAIESSLDRYLSGAMNLAATTSLANDTENVLPEQQLVWIKKWLPYLTQVRSAPEQRLALQLVACLGLWQFSPQELQQTSAWELWFNALGDSVHRVKLPAAELSVAGGAVASRSVVSGSESDAPGKISTRTPVSANDRELAASTASNSNKVASPQTQTATELNTQSDTSSRAETPETAQGDVAINYCYIQQAGFLYLLNWLRDYPALINLPVPLSPWLWLAHFYRHCCAAWQLPQDKNLQQLLLDIGGLSEQDSAESESLFAAAELQAARMYLQERLAKFQIENYDWLYVPARVWTEQGYVQIYIHELCVRVQLRMAGLDLNPGWVPSLGRVIQFYFGRYPELYSAEGGLPDE